MNTEIINRVAKSNLITIDLSDYYPRGKRAVIDIKNWLKEGFVLIEKDFRQSLNNYNWNQFKAHHIAIFCSTDAIVPIWAYMLVQKHLNGIAKSITFGSFRLNAAQDSSNIPSPPLASPTEHPVGSLQTPHPPKVVYTRKVVYIPLLIPIGPALDYALGAIPGNADHCTEQRLRAANFQ